MFDLSGRVALVTGGNGGIGLGLAKGLAACGARVVITGRDKEKNTAALKELNGKELGGKELGGKELGGKAHSIAADLAQTGETDRVLAETLALGDGLAILVNNAGTNLRAPPHEVTDDQWQTVLEINLNSMMRLTRAAYPALKASGHGRIINTGSMLSIFGVLFSPAYGASKGAVVQYTKSLAVAWAKDGITANSILPGWIDTDLTRRARQYSSTLHDSVLNRTPMGRWGDPKDFIGIAAFLASDEAAFITGTAIPIDGGFSTQG